MPRTRRRISTGNVYHLISRFVDREWFITCDEERDLYLRLLGHALMESDWRCLAYAIMSNHIHLATVAGAEPLDSWLRRVHSPFANEMNARHDRIGPLFVRGPKDIPVDSSRVGNVIAYIHNNPVRAGLVARARDSTWTSHRAYVGCSNVPPWLWVEEGLERAGFVDEDEFDTWVADPESDREETENIQALERRSLITRRKKSSVDANVLVQTVANELDISLGRLRSTRRGEVEVLGRQLTVICGQMVGLTCVEIASALEVTPQAISRIGKQDTDAELQTFAHAILERATELSDNVRSVAHP